MARGPYEAMCYTYRYALSYVTLLPYVLKKNPQHFSYSAILILISALLFFDDVITVKSLENDILRHKMTAGH